MTMLTREGCQARRKRLWASVSDQTEWLLIADPRHVNYLANFWVNPLSFSGGERGLLLLERDRGATLIGDNFSLRSAASEPHIDREVVEKWYDHKHSVINRDHALLNALRQIADQLYGRPGVVEAEWLPLGAWEILGLDWETHSVTREAGMKAEPGAAPDLGTLIRTLRRHKEPDEIELLKLCMKATDAGHARAREFIAEGVSELDVYREVQFAALAAAGRPGLVYGDFRATNATTPKAGGVPTSYKLQAGDLFILDYSVVLNGYRSDFTNTYAVSQPTTEQQSLFDHCLAGMQAAEKILKNGVAAKTVYETASEELAKAGHGPLSHHAGHGIGLAHPEPPILVPESTDTLRTGDVITLEPGLYIEGIGGIRIEHNYLITESGAETLSSHKISLR